MGGRPPTLKRRGAWGRRARRSQSRARTTTTHGPGLPTDETRSAPCCTLFPARSHATKPVPLTRPNGRQSPSRSLAPSTHTHTQTQRCGAAAPSRRPHQVRCGAAALSRRPHQVRCGAAVPSRRPHQASQGALRAPHRVPSGRPTRCPAELWRVRACGFGRGNPASGRAQAVPKLKPLAVPYPRPPVPSRHPTSLLSGYPSRLVHSPGAAQGPGASVRRPRH